MPGILVLLSYISAWPRLQWHLSLLFIDEEIRAGRKNMSLKLA
jgi:hypothetical protein